METVMKIEHSGVAHDENPPGRGSGRYPYGSGENPHQHEFTFLSEVKRLKKNGLTDADIAKVLLGEKATTTDLRAEYSIQTKLKRQAERTQAIQLLDESHGNVSEVARKMGKNESSVRNLLNDTIAERTDRYQNTADFLRKRADEMGIIDISTGSELYIRGGVPDYTKKVAVAMLEKEGYVKSWVQIPQMGTQFKTSIMVLAKPGTTYSEIQKNKYNIKPIVDFTPDEGKTWWSPAFPESIDSKRILIKYDEDGGSLKDGLIELRPGVRDISLNGSIYSQVRIAVDGTHYMKGMAIYNPDIPKGYDVIYNTNKHSGTDKYKVFKEMKVDERTGEIDRDNPFGAAIRLPKEVDGILTAAGQHYYTDKNGEKKLSLINKVNDEGDWSTWSKKLSAQFLSKQPIELITQQIDLTVKERKVEFEKIMQLNNPLIRKKVLEDFAEQCDTSAVNLATKGFKKQAFQVILPVTELKDNEIYAKNYKDGDRVALVRYPHGGTFEIPVLTVNNRHPKAKEILGQTTDAVGINHRVAEILSGADFDGDSVLVIPMSSNRIKLSTDKPLKALEGFNAKELYKLPPETVRAVELYDKYGGNMNLVAKEMGMSKTQANRYFKRQISYKNMQTEMGKVTNLIADMTIGGAPMSDIAKAVKHSMVVIDSYKHHLDYKRSAIDNDIVELKKKYQGVNSKGQAKGASTIVSQSSSKVYVPIRKEITNPSMMTPEELKRYYEGKRVYRETGEKRAQITTLKDGTKKIKEKDVQIEVSKMSLTDDARTLVRDKSNKKEMAYAEYANEMKALANLSRKEARAIKANPVSKSAKEIYRDEVASLDSKIRLAKSNAPKERYANTVANAAVIPKFKSNPQIDYDHRQKERALALVNARALVGAKKERIELTDREWDAIQANAISSNKLSSIISNSNLDKLKSRAMPKQSDSLTASQISLVMAMKNTNMYSNQEIAERVGTSLSTITRTIRSEKGVE